MVEHVVCDKRLVNESRSSVYAANQRMNRNRTLLILVALLLGICFWYSVPYSFPLRLDPDPIRAASGEADAFHGSLSRQIAMPLAFLLCAVSLYRLPPQSRIVKSRLLLSVLAYIGWVLISLTWSTDPEITRKRLVVFLIDVLVAYTIARHATLRELALFGFIATSVVAGIALFADVVLLGDFRPFDPDYRFMGVMTANYQAMNLFVCLVCGLTLLESRPHWMRWLGPLLTLAAGLLFLTRARIGTILFLVVFAVTFVRVVKRDLRSHARALLVLVLAAVVVPGVLLVGARNGGSALMSIFMMGRHDTENTASLSNRAPLWAELSDSVRRRPWLGTGFQAFWSPERVEKISLDQGWVVPHAHNTYLDEVLSLGVVGGVLYAGTLVGACTVAWKRYRRLPEPFQLLPVLLLAWILLLSLTESLPLTPYLPTLLAYSCVARMCMREIRNETKEPGLGRAWVATGGNGAFSMRNRQWQSGAEA